MATLDLDDIEDTAPSTPYPFARFRVLRKGLHAVRSWVLGVMGVKED